MTNASAMLLGILNDVFVTYQYNKSGQVLPQGTPQQRSFIEHTYAGYMGDAWRVSRELTLNFGLRYENFRPPYEANGLQVDTTVPLNQYFAQRNGLQSQGIPANQMSDFTLSYALNGPVNGKPSWWSPGQRKFRAAVRAGLRARGPRRVAREAFRQERRLPSRRGHRVRSVRQRLDREIRSVRLAGSYPIPPISPIRTASPLRRASPGHIPRCRPPPRAVSPTRLPPSPPSPALSWAFRPI